MSTLLHSLETCDSTTRLFALLVRRSRPQILPTQNKYKARLKARGEKHQHRSIQTKISNQVDITMRAKNYDSKAVLHASLLCPTILMCPIPKPNRQFLVPQCFALPNVQYEGVASRSTYCQSASTSTCMFVCSPHDSIAYCPSRLIHTSACDKSSTISPLFGFPIHHGSVRLHSRHRRVAA